jgi:adhesin HecA-like repeat protein
MKLSNRNRSFYFAILLIGCAFAMPAYANTIVSIVNPGFVTLGNSFTASIFITGAIDVYAFQFDFSFDPTILQATSVTEGPFLPSGGTTFFIPGAIDNTNGVIGATADTLIGAIAGVNGNGDLVDIAFTTVGNGTSSLDLANEIFLDSNLNDITATITFTGSSVSVSAVPEPMTLALLALGIAGVSKKLRTNNRPGH